MKKQSTKIIHVNVFVWIETVIAVTLCKIKPKVNI